MKTLHLATGLGLVLICVGCGSGSGASASDAASGSAAASTAAASSGSTGSSKVVSHEKLVALLPAMAGWTQDFEPRGETDAALNVSRVTVDYTREGGTGSIGIEMMDVVANSAMLAPLKQMLKLQGERKTAAGVEKVTSVAGFPAVEEWTAEAGNGSMSVLLSDRFVVTVTGNSVGSVDVIHKVMEAIDLKKIAALR